MNIKKVKAAYFTGTGTTKKIVTIIAQEAASILGVPWEDIDFSLPEIRKTPLVFAKNELIVFGLFVVAGRVPNVLLPFLQTIQRNESILVPVVVYGNRSYGDALLELKDLLEKSGSHISGAAAFIGEHSFSDILAKNRPDSKDIALAKKFAKKIAHKTQTHNLNHPPVEIPGTVFPYQNYYQPLNIEGKPVRFLKAKPHTDENCIDCKHCADICPMGAIDRNDVGNVPGLCIKCCACIKKCPVSAKHFVNEDFLSHKEMLERTYTKRREPELFL